MPLARKLFDNSYFTILDPNANPNKRQRQPALLGDHPPDYGKYPIKKLVCHIEEWITKQ